MYKLWDYECPAGHISEQLIESRWDAMAWCPECGEAASRLIGGKNRQLYYEEGRARVDWNLGPNPVMITSEKQHQKLMKEAGVTLAGTRRGMKGQWV